MSSRGQGMKLSDGRKGRGCLPKNQMGYICPDCKIILERKVIRIEKSLWTNAAGSDEVEIHGHVCPQCNYTI